MKVASLSTKRARILFFYYYFSKKIENGRKLFTDKLKLIARKSRTTTHRKGMEFMTYHVQLVKLLFSMEDHLYRIQRAEKISNLWKVTGFLAVVSLFLYGWMAYLGIGSELISREAVGLGMEQYEASKFWFIVGRMLYGLLFTVLVIAVPALLFHYLTGIPFQKLVIMQQVVFSILLLERLTWIPLAVFFGLDWYVSPASFGILFSFITDKAWLIYFFGAISLFQLWVISFQVTYLRKLSSMSKQRIWLSVLFLHIVEWAFVSLFAFMDRYLIGGWFG
ncbi:hypothetical protein [Virgibacillus sp. MG-45]|uniref:hypothetical protein n=1 Tax=Virgibacillus sp. MG-45 TaxID=3102791 RepID=UPI002ED81C34